MCLQANDVDFGLSEAYMDDCANDEDEIPKKKFKIGSVPVNSTENIIVHGDIMKRLLKKSPCEICGGIIVECSELTVGCVINYRIKCEAGIPIRFIHKSQFTENFTNST